ncbi:MAG: hypothetical protein ABW157_03590 [Candidatus Thiodiazotropha sp. LLP2]
MRCKSGLKSRPEREKWRALAQSACSIFDNLTTQEQIHCQTCPGSAWQYMPQISSRFQNPADDQLTQPSNPLDIATHSNPPGTWLHIQPGSTGQAFKQ